MATTTSKVCRLCNLDCSDRPRSKDELGRYTCKACADKLAAEDSARTRGAGSRGVAGTIGVSGAQVTGVRGVPVRGDDDGVDLRAAAMIESKAQMAELPEKQSCPRCHSFLPESDRLCMRCGFDRKLGAKRSTRVEAEKPDPAEKQSRATPVDVTWMVVGYGVVTVGLAVAALMVPSVFVPAVILHMVLAIALSVTVLVCQFRDGDTIYAVCTLASFFVGITGLVTLYWLFAVNDRGWLKGLWASSVLANILLLIAMLTNPELRESLPF